MKYNKKINIFWMIVLGISIIATPIELYAVFIQGKEIPNDTFFIYGLAFFFFALGLFFGELEKYFRNKKLRLQKEIKVLENEE